MIRGVAIEGAGGQLPPGLQGGPLVRSKTKQGIAGPWGRTQKRVPLGRADQKRFVSRTFL